MCIRDSFMTPSLLGLECQLERSSWSGDSVLSATMMPTSPGPQSHTSSTQIVLVRPAGLLDLCSPQVQWDMGDQNMLSKLRAAFGHFWKEQAVELDRVMRYSLSVSSAARNSAILECSRQDILQAADFGLLSFQRTGPRQPSLILEMLQEKLQRHQRYMEMLALQGKLPNGQVSLLDELAPEGRAELLEHHAMIWAARQLLQLQGGEAGQSRVMMELILCAIDIMRSRLVKTTTAMTSDPKRREQASAADFDAMFWLYSYTWSMNEFLSAVLEAHRQLLPSLDVYELGASVGFIWEVVLGSVVSVFEQQQRDGFIITENQLWFPRLPYLLRAELFEVIRHVGHRIEDRLQGSWAPQLKRSLLVLVRLYLMAHRAHGLAKQGEVSLAQGPYEDKEYAKPHDMLGGAKLVLFRRSKVLYSLMVCDSPSAQQLAEEFEDCTTLVYVALRTEDPVAGRAKLVEYVSRFGKVFMTELLALLFAHRRTGDILEFVLKDVHQEHRELALESLQEFIDDELKCVEGGNDAEARLHQLQWLMQLRAGSAAPDSASCEAAAIALHKLGGHGGVLDQQTHAALACLTAAATEPTSGQQGSRSMAVTSALKRCRLRAMEVALCPEEFTARCCGVGEYPVVLEAAAKSTRELVGVCLAEVTFDSLKERFHSHLQGRWPEEVAMERLQDWSIQRRVCALEILDLELSGTKVVELLRSMCPSVWQRASAAVATLSLDQVEHELNRRGMLTPELSDADKRHGLEAAFRQEDQHHDTSLLDAMRSLMDGDHTKSANAPAIMQARELLKYRLLIWSGNPQKYGRKEHHQDLPQVPGALDDPSSLPEIDWEATGSGMILEGYMNSSFYRTANEWLEFVKARSGQQCRDDELRLMQVQFQHAHLPQFVSDLTSGGFFQGGRRAHVIESHDLVQDFAEELAEDDV
eukprot:TRINITY_DN10687_c0_g1_i2.p1 TRINITY_DN10687_c0_g1~~TRINITY_DN10687_c0_g1_i2.p1  ORF type:complete len:924 (+),score=269.64 TRINITY_DN10687_c0_g1_i2:128-2899(+)